MRARIPIERKIKTYPKIHTLVQHTSTAFIVDMKASKRRQAQSERTVCHQRQTQEIF